MPEGEDLRIAQGHCPGSSQAGATAYICGMLSALHRVYRRTGADLPFGDPGRAHGIGMEGYFWRVTLPDERRVLVALCGACRGEAGEWSLVAVAGHPGRFLRVAETDGAGPDPQRFAVRAGTLLHGDGDRLHVDVPGARVDLRLDPVLPYPRRIFGGLGAAQAIPGLHQYWHPHLLEARASGTIELDGTRTEVDAVPAYAEKNWGRDFAADWWWGQASAVGDDDVTVAFAGGHIELGPARISPTSVVVALRGEIIRLVPPTALTLATMGDGAWRVRAHDVRHTIEIEGEAGDVPPHALPVPLPDTRDSVVASRHHLAGRLAVSVRRGRRTLFRGESDLAGLERGHAPRAGSPR